MCIVHMCGCEEFNEQSSDDKINNNLIVICVCVCVSHTNHKSNYSFKVHRQPERQHIPLDPLALVSI